MDDRHVYIPLRDTGVVALDRERGTQVWFRPLATLFHPVVTDGTVIVATAAGLEAFDAETGADRWTLPLPRKVIAPLVLDTGWLIAVVEPDEVLAFRASDASPIWRASIGTAPAFAPVPGGDAALYITRTDGSVLALALADGARLWERALPGTLSEPAAGRDRVFIGSTDNSFTALDAGTGEIAWRW